MTLRVLESEDNKKFVIKERNSVQSDRNSVSSNAAPNSIYINSNQVNTIFQCIIS